MAALAVGALLGAAGEARGGLSGSAHDFSAQGWAAGDLCITCHAPHGRLDTEATPPLWNHETTQSTYTLYSSPTLDATDVGQPSGVSKLCLSCHDGTVAVDSFGGQEGSTFVAGDARIGTDLSNEHPISFTYDDQLALDDGGLRMPTVEPSGLGGSIDQDLLFGRKLECGSCHDVHDVRGIPGLLRIHNSGSALCLTCHDK